MEEQESSLDNDLKELNKIIQSANELANQLGGVQLNNLHEQLLGNIRNIPVPVPPKTPTYLNENKNTVILNYINESNNEPPKFETGGSSGFDLRANLEQPIVAKPMVLTVVPTGLYFEIENGYEIQVRSRSGLARKNQLFVLNQPGTVDSDYRGEVIVMLFNLGKNDVQINNGDRIAQGVVCPVIGASKLTILQVDQLTQTQRNAGGFGHTGIQ